MTRIHSVERSFMTASSAPLMRTAEISRKTAETDIVLAINLDGSGQAELDTGIGFFDHMLEQIARHGRSICA